MVDINEIAIADCLKHPKLGIISFQPDLNYKYDNDIIHVRDIGFNLFTVKASKCKWATPQECNDYWEVINKMKENK